MSAAPNNSNHAVGSLLSVEILVYSGTKIGFCDLLQTSYNYCMTDCLVPRDSLLKTEYPSSLLIILDGRLTRTEGYSGIDFT